MHCYLDLRLYPFCARLFFQRFHLLWLVKRSYRKPWNIPGVPRTRDNALVRSRRVILLVRGEQYWPSREENQTDYAFVSRADRGAIGGVVAEWGNKGGAAPAGLASHDGETTAADAGADACARECGCPAWRRAAPARAWPLCSGQMLQPPVAPGSACNKATGKKGQMKEGWGTSLLSLCLFVTRYRRKKPAEL